MEERPKHPRALMEFESVEKTGIKALVWQNNGFKSITPHVTYMKKGTKDLKTRTFLFASEVRHIIPLLKQAAEYVMMLDPPVYPPSVAERVYPRTIMQVTPDELDEQDFPVD